MRTLRLDDHLKFPLYKYTKREYGERLFDLGELRLGTIYDYARNETYRLGVHDRHEGYYAWRVPEKQCQEGVPEVRLILTRNNLVYCASEIHDPLLYTAFDADFCYRINDLRFFQYIDWALRHEYITALIRRVVYYNKSRWDCLPDYEDFAGVMKDSSFEHQHEVRALWEPIMEPPRRFIHHFSPERVNEDGLFLVSIVEDDWYQEWAILMCNWLKPRIISVPDAAKYCTPLSKPD